MSIFEKNQTLGQMAVNSNLEMFISCFGMKNTPALPEALAAIKEFRNDPLICIAVFQRADWQDLSLEDAQALVPMDMTDSVSMALHISRKTFDIEAAIILLEKNRNDILIASAILYREDLHLSEAMWHIFNSGAYSDNERKYRSNGSQATIAWIMFIARKDVDVYLNKLDDKEYMDTYTQEEYKRYLARHARNKKVA